MSRCKNEQSGLPDYETPPVIEVVCGLVFDKIEQLKGPHFGLFWKKVRQDYPKCEHAFPLGFKPESFDLINNLPSPRIWFIEKEDNKLIQLQNNIIFFNWRKVRMEEPYPRYRTIIENFKCILKELQEFLEEESLGSISPASCELTYINQIPKGSGWETLSDINKVFPDLNWRSEKKRFLPQPIHIDWKITFPLPDDQGRLKISLQNAERSSDNCPVFLLNFTAQGLGGKKSMDAVWEWFEVAHEWIVCGFSDLTGNKVQEEVWGRTSNPGGKC